MLVESDRELYFPSVLLTGVELQAAVLKAQTVAETIACRGLNVCQYHETIEFFDGRAGLTFFPIVSDLEIKVTSLDGTALIVKDLDYKQGNMKLHTHLAFCVAKVSYFAGFSPKDTDQTTISVKSAIAAILNYQVLNNGS